jgi:tetratricopeptide (TPR) repeat protein
LSRLKTIAARFDSTGVFALAFVVRLWHVWALRASPFFSVLMGDSRGYDEWARRIAAGDWLGTEVFYQAPLYPYVLGILYTVAGRHLLLVRVMQAAIGSASCALLAMAAARFFSSRAIGLAAGVMLALYAPAIFFDGLIQKSVLDVFFVCLALYLISIATTTKTIDAEHAEIADKKHHKKSSQRIPRSSSPPPSLFFALGLTMGGLSLTRENALVFIIVILAWMLFDAARVKRAAFFLAGLAIVLVPVAARNNYVGGGFYITTSQFGPNLYIGNNARSDGTYQSLRFGRGAPEYERQDATELAEHALGRSLTPAEVSGYWTDQAMHFITSRPGAWLALMGRKTALLWNATEMLDTESQEAHADWSLPLRILGPLGNFGVLVPLALFGVIVSWPLRARLWILYAMTLAYAASVVAFYVFARYRYPLVPFLMLFAAAGLVALPGALRSRAVPGRTARGRALTVAALVLVAVFANWRIVSADSMRAITESNLGVALQAEQRTDEAIAHYRRAIGLRPDYAPVYSNLASALRASGRLQEAVETYQHALTLQPDFPDAQYNLANALLDQGKADAAIEHFQIALKSIPASADVETNLGIAFAAKGNVQGSADAFRRALVIDPRSAKAERNLGDLLAAAGQSAEGVDHLKRAIQIAPGDASAHYDLGSLFLELQRLDDAIAEFHAALAITPNAAEIHNNLGIALGTQGQLDAAIDEFQRALAIDPGSADAKRNLAFATTARNRLRR